MEVIEDSWGDAYKEIVTSPSRWHTEVVTLFKDPDSSETYGVAWRRGNTENQEHEFPIGDTECHEYEQIEIVTKKWQRVK